MVNSFTPIATAKEELAQAQLAQSADTNNPVAVSSLTNVHTITRNTQSVVENTHREIFKSFGKDMIVDEGIQEAIADSVIHLKYIQNRMKNDESIIDASLKSIAEYNTTSNKRALKKGISEEKIAKLLQDIQDEGGRIERSIEAITRNSAGRKGPTTIPERLYEQLSVLGGKLTKTEDKIELLTTIMNIYVVYQNTITDAIKYIDGSVSDFEKLHRMSKQINTQNPAPIEYTHGSDGTINLGSLCLQSGVDTTQWEMSVGDDKYHSVYVPNTLTIQTELVNKDGVKKPCTIEIKNYNNDGIINKKDIRILDPYDRSGGTPQPFGFENYPLQLNLHTEVISKEHFNKAGKGKKEKLKGRLTIPFTIEQPQLSDNAKKNEINKVYTETNSPAGSGTPRPYDVIATDLIDKSCSETRIMSKAKDAFQRMGSQMAVYDDALLDGFVSQIMTNDKDSTPSKDLLGAIKKFIQDVSKNPLLRGKINSSYSLDNFFSHLSMTLGDTLPGFKGGDQAAFGKAFKEYMDNLAGGDYVSDSSWLKFINSNEFRDVIVTSICSQNYNFELKRPGATTADTKTFLDHYTTYVTDLDKDYPKVTELSPEMTCKPEIYDNVFPKFGSVGPLTAEVTLRDGKEVNISSDISYDSHTKRFTSKTKITWKDGTKLLPSASSSDTDIIAANLTSTNDIAKHIEDLAKDMENSTGDKKNKRYAGHTSSVLHTLLLDRIAIAMGVDENGMAYDDSTGESGIISYQKNGLDPTKGILSVHKSSGTITSYKQDLSQKLEGTQVNDVLKAYNIALFHRKDTIQSAISGDSEIPKLLFPETMMGQTIKIAENLYLRGNKDGKVVWVKEDLPDHPESRLHYDSISKKRVPYKAGEWKEGFDMIKERYSAAVETHDRTVKSARKLGRTLMTDIRHMAQGFVTYPFKAVTSLRNGSRRGLNYMTSLFRPQNEPSQYEDVEDFYNNVMQIDQAGSAGDDTYTAFRDSRANKIKEMMIHTYMTQSESTMTSLSDRLKDLIAKGGDDQGFLAKLLTNFIKEKLLNYGQSADEIKQKLDSLIDTITNESDPRAYDEKIAIWLETGMQSSKGCQEFVNKHSKNILEILYTKRGDSRTDDKQAKIRMYAKGMMVKNAFSEVAQNSRKVLKNLVRDQTVDLIHLARDTIGLGINTTRTTIGHAKTVAGVIQVASQGIGEVFGSKRMGRDDRISKYTVENAIKNMPPEANDINTEHKIDSPAEVEDHIMRSVMDHQMKHVTDRRAEATATIGQNNVKATGANNLREGGIMTKLTINGTERRFVMTEGDNGGVSISEVSTTDIATIATGSGTLEERAFQRNIDLTDPKNKAFVDQQRAKQTKDMELNPATLEGEQGYCKISPAMIHHRKAEKLRDRPSPILWSVDVQPGQPVAGTGLSEWIQNPHIMTSMMNAADNLYPKKPYRDIPKILTGAVPSTAKKVRNIGENISEGRKRWFKQSI